MTEPTQAQVAAAQRELERWLGICDAGAARAALVAALAVEDPPISSQPAVRDVRAVGGLGGDPQTGQQTGDAADG